MNDNGATEIEGVLITRLQKLNGPKGDILHVMKCSDEGFCGFGEAYFSTVKEGEIKGWKQHQRMTLNIVVPIGEIRFMIYDLRKGSDTKGNFLDVFMSRENYLRLTVPSGLWLAFEGRSPGINMLLNLASHEHDPSEAVTADLTSIQNSCFPSSGG